MSCTASFGSLSYHPKLIAALCDNLKCYPLLTLLYFDSFEFYAVPFCLHSDTWQPCTPVIDIDTQADVNAEQSQLLPLAWCNAIECSTLATRRYVNRRSSEHI